MSAIEKILNTETLPHRSVTRREFLRRIRAANPQMTAAKAAMHAGFSEHAGAWCLVGGEMLRITAKENDNA